MPVVYAILPDLRLIYCVGFDNVVSQDFWTLEQTLYTQPLYHPGMAVIVDLQAVTEVEVEVADYPRLYALGREMTAAGQPPLKFAFLVRNHSDEATVKSLAELSKPFTPWRLATFHTLGAAEVWLELEPHHAVIEAARRDLYQEHVPASDE